MRSPGAHRAIVTVATGVVCSLVNLKLPHGRDHEKRLCHLLWLKRPGSFAASQKHCERRRLRYRATNRDRVPFYVSSIATLPAVGLSMRTTEDLGTERRPPAASRRLRPLAWTFQVREAIPASTAFIPTRLRVGLTQVLQVAR